MKHCDFRTEYSDSRLSTKVLEINVGIFRIKCCNFRIDLTVSESGALISEEEKLILELTKAISQKRLFRIKFQN